MRLLTYLDGTEPRIGVLEGRVLDLAEAAGRLPCPPRAALAPDLATLLAGGLEEAAQIVEHARRHPDWWQPLEELTLLPPIPRPGKILALGKNYRAHAAETGSPPPDYPMIFQKPASCLIGSGAPIVIPPVTRRVDFEGELAVVIGCRSKNVPREEALSRVGGYSIANDVSARDLQRRTSQFASGKILDTFGPMGPVVVTRDEIPDPQALRIRTQVNGETLQDASTAEMIFDVAFLVSYLSELVTLEPGDVILTGTPEGVGFARQPPVYLQDGDLVEIDISGLGVLRNPVREEQ